MKINFADIPDFLQVGNDDVWFWFNEIRKIPRPSKKEEKIKEYILSLVNQKEFTYFEDIAGNLIVKVPGVRDNFVALQAHLDMVCEKNSDVDFNFDKDQIKIFESDGFLRAKGTTLGADNGIGVAYMLALMMNGYDNLPNLELIFTVDEEQGLGGALGFEKDVLKASYMINLDSEEDNFVTIGCAGAIEFNIKNKFELIDLNKDLNFYELKIFGLAGGHSGTEINLFKRGNAIKHLFFILNKVLEVYSFNLIKIEAGSASNAIPREAKIIFASHFKKDELKECIELIMAFLDKIYDSFQFKLAIIESYNKGLSFDDSEKLIKSINGVHCGVLSQSQDVEGQVETSINLGILNLSQGVFEAVFMARSFNDFAQEEVFDKYKNYFEVLDFNVLKSFEFNGWEPDINSKLLQLTKEKYFELFGSEIQIMAIHAGLECGILKKNYPNLDVISIGPNIFDAHSPTERVEIKSVDKIWNLLIELLRNI